MVWTALKIWCYTALKKAGGGTKSEELYSVFFLISLAEFDPRARWRTNGFLLRPTPNALTWPNPPTRRGGAISCRIPHAVKACSLHNEVPTKEAAL
jgi:hypothetical protein